MEILDIIKAIIFGIVEGITEWLPISSTGHIILLNEFFTLDISEEFWNLFIVAIQLGAIIAVVILFFNRLNPFSLNKEEHIKKDVLSIWLKVLVACLPAAIVGLLLDDWFDAHFYNLPSVATVLIIYGVLFILIELYNKKRTPKYETVHDITYLMALIIGLAQLLSLVPGTSRSGVTILAAMLIGCSRTSSAEFSFFLSIPVMFGACLFKGVKYGLDYGMPGEKELAILGIGAVMALFVSLLCIKFLMNFIKKHDFKIFGVYRIILGIILLIIFMV